VKTGPGQKDLAAHLEAGGYLPRYGKGYAPDCPQVLRYIFAAEAVAPRSPGGQLTVHIGQGYRQAVNLMLAGKFEWLPGQQPGGSGVPGQQLVLGENVTQRQQGHGVFHGPKGFHRGGADPLRGGVGGQKDGVGLLQVFQLLH
jgi:hypothetical protein